MTQHYAEWLTAIVNTRLLFNTTEECEAFLDSGSIRSICGRGRSKPAD